MPFALTSDTVFALLICVAARMADRAARRSEIRMRLSVHSVCRATALILATAVSLTTESALAQTTHIKFAL
jgi:hypothetical protein